MSRPTFSPSPLNHSWDLSPKEAIRLQMELRNLVQTEDNFVEIHRIAGADVAFTMDGKHCIAGILLFEFPSLQEMQRVYVTAPLVFPYVPGLLSFRETPALLKGFKKLKKQPDLILIDGHGLAHPRRLGIASHIGLVLGIPTIGCAKSRLCGEHEEPGKTRGDWAWLTHKGEKIGAVLRTRDDVKPIYISCGHRVSLKSAVKIVLACHDGTRIPKPTREADRFVGELKRQGVKK